MRVLICGGRKTINVIKSLTPRFNSGSVAFIMENDIKGIESLLNRGEYFDRAVIIEQSWTNDGEEQNEITMRNSINSFVNLLRNKCSKDATCLFVATTEKMATIVAEETLEITSESRIILKEPPYAVSFFTMLVTQDLSHIPDNFIFRLSDDDTVIDVDEIGDVEGGLDGITFREPLEKAKDVEIDVKHAENEEKENEGSEVQEIFDFDEEFFNGNSVEYDKETLIEQVEIEDVEDNVEDEIETSIDIENNEQGLEEEVYDNDNDEPIDTEDNQEISENDYVDTYDEDAIEVDEINVDTEEQQFNKAHEPEYKDSNALEFDSIDILELMGVETLKDNDIKVEDSTLEVNVQTNVEQNIKHRYSKSNKGKPISRDPSKDSIEALKSILNTFSNRGSSLVVTGAGACGTSTLAFNIANTIVKLGYTVLLVDLDTVGRAQAYISEDAYEAVHSHDTSNSSLKMALSNPNIGVGRYVNIIAPGFHLLTMGLAGDIVKSTDIAERQKMIKFSNIVRADYNFIVYDIPFESAITHCSDITYTADNLVITVDSSNWGVMKSLLNISNIESEDIQELIFRRAQLCFTKYRGLDRMLGAKVKSIKDVLARMDIVIKDLLGVEPEYLFSDMRICGVMPHDERYEQSWFNSKQFSDYKDGYAMIIELLNKIMLKG